MAVPFRASSGSFGNGASTATMLWHGAARGPACSRYVAMTLWRGFQRSTAQRNGAGQCRSYLLTGVRCWAPCLHGTPAPSWLLKFGCM